MHYFNDFDDLNKAVSVLVSVSVFLVTAGQ